MPYRHEPIEPVPEAVVVRALVGALMRAEMRRYFRRVAWVGPPPPLVPDRPVVAYVNHHHVYDGHLLWLLARTLLDRPATTWMAEWDRFPLFAAVGAQPFPLDNARRRLRTVRRTARRFREHPRTLLAYFPEARLHPPEDGLLPFDDITFQRLGRVFETAQWWPVAVHVTWWGEKYPTALLTGGVPTPAPPSDARERLTATWRRLRATSRAQAEAANGGVRVLLDGRHGPEEGWNLDIAATFFSRYL